MSYENIEGDVRLILMAQSVKDGSQISAPFSFIVDDIIDVAEHESEVWEYWESAIEKEKERE